jgi:ketosteroid isomerase-like protein
MSMGNQHMGKAAIVAMIKTAKCDIKDMKESEPQLSKVNDDTYAITYKSEGTGTCTENGKTIPVKPMRASTIWVRNGDKWQAVWHGENEIAAAAPADQKAAEPKKEDAKATEAKKEEAKPAANTAAAPEPAKLTPSANTDALSKAHAAGWEAFRNKDAKAFDSMIASSFSGVGPDGSVFASKADAIKMWTETMKCEGVTKTSFTDGFAQAVSPTVEILFGKGNADGKCDGHPNGDLWQTAVYVKEGDAWKLAFMMESMPPPAA